MSFFLSLSGWIFPLRWGSSSSLLILPGLLRSDWGGLSDSSPLHHDLLSWVAPRAWLSFIALDKPVVPVIRLTSFLWLWFQCVCPLMPSRNTYHLTWVSLTLDVGYLFMAAPARRRENGRTPAAFVGDVNSLLWNFIQPLFFTEFLRWAILFSPLFISLINV